MSSSDRRRVLAYYDYIHQRKQALFALYKDEDLGKKEYGHGMGWTWGYRLLVDGQMATGSSIGEDEIRIFLDLPHLLDARYSFCVGVAFGLSTFCLALSKADNIVHCIDNYSERMGSATNRAKEFVLKTIEAHFPNVRLTIGTSPEDTVQCLSELSDKEKLSIAFIDGFHSNEAAEADFHGMGSYIDQKTVVLWHNADAISHAFESCFDPSLHDRRHILKTYGTMGIYYNSKEHPVLTSYLADNCLVWNSWQQQTAAGMGRLSGEPTLSEREQSLISLKRRIVSAGRNVVQRTRGTRG